MCQYPTVNYWNTIIQRFNIFDCWVSSEAANSHLENPLRQKLQTRNEIPNFPLIKVNLVMKCDILEGIVYSDNSGSNA